MSDQSISYLLLLLVCLLIAVSQLCQKQAVRQQSFCWRLLLSPWLQGAVFALGVALLLWLIVLQRLAVGVAYPLLSVNSILVLAGAHFCFKEPIQQRHWVGVICIVVGIVLLAGGV